MSFDPLTALFDAGKMAIERIWPDPHKRAEELIKLEKLRDDGDARLLGAEVKLLVGQMEVNKVEAAHPSIFVAGWRPFIGWCGGWSLAYAGIAYPLLLWVWKIAQAFGWVSAEMDPPPLTDNQTLVTIVTGMLGIGGMRSYDKKSGTETSRIGAKK